jgi:peptide/nickel transport system substrate-binding protein
LRESARWSDGKAVDSRDVLGTLELLQKSPQLACAEGLDVIDAQRARIDDKLHVRMSFRQGVLEPLGRTTFKVVPARYLKAESKDADDDLFARKPFGSGPYRYEGREKDGDREAAVFRANPYYSQRAGKFGLPNIQEIRFVVPDLSTVADDFARGQMHLVLDVPSGDLLRYLSNPASARLVKDFTSILNRRIFMLAINHRRLKLQNADLRRGLSAAIDRETILNNVYRPGGEQKYHRALTGPFPVNSWATPENVRKTPLSNRALAGGLLSSAVGKEPIQLSLVYPEDDRLAIRACTLIKEQVEAATKKAPTDAPLVEIVLTPVAANQLWWKLEQEQDFDLAYVPYDYNDDLYWLGGLLDRTAAGRGGRNILGYLAPGSNPQQADNDLRIAIDEIRAHRNFHDAQQETWKVHAQFLRRMPFVPLWQLDRHMIVHKDLEMYMETPGDKLSPDRIDPATVFPGVENWRLK